MLVLLLKNNSVLLVEWSLCMMKWPMILFLRNACREENTFLNMLNTIWLVYITVNIVGFGDGLKYT